MLRKTAIHIKKGECVGCTDGKSKPLTAGRCRTHYWIYRSKQNKGFNTKGKESSAIEAELPNKLAQRREVNRGTSKNDLVKWYSEHMASTAPVCENCGKPINKGNTFEWHGSQAHILPKSLFPSVATHPENHMVLGLYCCHGQFDSNWQNAEKMPVFRMAIERFGGFADTIAPEERRRIPEVFMFHESH